MNLVRKQLLSRTASRSLSAHIHEPRTPRYVRRDSAPQDPPSSPTRVYRSRHLDPAQPTRDKSEIKLLEPHVLSARLRKLCDARKLDDAVEMLKKAPLDAQNTPVWNTLIWESMKAERYKLAYQLFVDVRISPYLPCVSIIQSPPLDEAPRV